MAIVNHDSKLVFIHIPKTAGRSITTSLSGQLILNTHCSASWLFDTHPELQKYKSFAVVRNPWARMYSFYHFVYQRYAPEYKKLGFKHWLMEVENFNRDQFGPTEWHFPAQKRQQASFIMSSLGEQLVDHILHVETLQEELNHLYTDIGLPLINLPIIGPSQHGPYQEGYDSETIEFVAQTFKWDIELFDYTFE